MSNQIKGILKQVFPIQKINTKNGTMDKREFVIITNDVCFTLIKDKAVIIDKYAEGETINVTFSPESREYNGRYYTSLNAFLITSDGQHYTPEYNDDLPY